MNPSRTNSNSCQVKICGLRNALEVAALDSMEVDWIGFNFYPGSARYIAPEIAAPMISGLRKSIPVGVFVDAAPEEVIRIIRLTGIRCVQLHGHEDWKYILKMPVPVIKAIPHTSLADLGGLRGMLTGPEAQINPLAYFLVDTQVSSSGNGAFGGSGKTFDWSVLGQTEFPVPYFLAGGLGPENLGAALKACAPFAVDLNSRVEVSPGNKDLKKIQTCLDIVRR
jgi:phosphoribosylanthranilate isomerase